MELNNQVALITGASRGIGRAIALTMARQGASVAINYTSRKDAALDVLEEISQKGGRGMIVQADVSSDEDVKRMVEEIKSHMGSVTILVNNAGITRDGLLVRMKNEDWQQVLNANLTGAFYTCRAVSKDMMKAKHGRIINISSIVGLAGNAGQVNYSAAKAGLIGLTKSLAKELSSKNITVNAVAPGFIETEMTDTLPDKVIEQLMGRIPLARLGHTHDVAEAVCFLAGPGAGYITGQVLQVYGGIEL